MAEDEVDNLLEEAFKSVEEADKNGTKMDDVIMKKAKDVGIKTSSESKTRKRSRSKSGSRERKRKRSRSRSREKKKKDRERRRHSPDESKRSSGSSRRRSSSRDRRRRSRSRSRDRRPARRSRSPIVRRSRSPRRDERRSPAPRRLPGPERRDVMPFTPRKSPPRDARMDMSSEERDERTVFILQLARQTRPRDLEEFFSSVGHVRDVRVITDTKTRRSKGIAYVEFWERDAVPLAMGLSGQKVHGAPLVIQMSNAERNRAANAAATANQNTIGLGLGLSSGPLQLRVSNLHPNITDEMLAAIFEPFGRVERCYVKKGQDPDDPTAGTGYVTFRHAEEGRRAMEQLNGFELAQRNIRFSTVEEGEQQSSGGSARERDLREDDLPTPPKKEAMLAAEDRNINSSSRLQLIANLAKGRSDVELPQVTQEAIAAQQAQKQSADIPAFATQCFMLSNMFDPSKETEPGWDLDIRDDVIEECTSHGGCVHVYIDKASPQGNVYVKCPTVAIAHKSVAALHGRWFAGKVITANYVPVASYHELFPDAKMATMALQPRPAQ